MGDKNNHKVYQMSGEEFSKVMLRSRGLDDPLIEMYLPDKMVLVSKLAADRLGDIFQGQWDRVTVRIELDEAGELYSIVIGQYEKAGEYNVSIEVRVDK